MKNKVPRCFQWADFRTVWFVGSPSPQPATVKMLMETPALTPTLCCENLSGNARPHPIPSPPGRGRTDGRWLKFTCLVALSANMKTPQGEGESSPVGREIGHVLNAVRWAAMAEPTFVPPIVVRTPSLLLGEKDRMRARSFNQLQLILIRFLYHFFRRRTKNDDRTQRMRKGKAGLPIAAIFHFPSSILLFQQ